MFIEIADTDLLCFDILLGLELKFAFSSGISYLIYNINYTKLNLQATKRWYEYILKTGSIRYTN